MGEPALIEALREGSALISQEVEKERETAPSVVSLGTEEVSKIKFFNLTFNIKIFLI
jgi:hypothetical protein